MNINLITGFCNAAELKRLKPLSAPKDKVNTDTFKAQMKTIKLHSLLDRTHSGAN